MTPHQVPGRQSRAGSPFLAHSCGCLPFLPPAPWPEAHSFSLPASAAPPPPHPRRASLPSHIRSLPGPPSPPLGWFPTLSSQRPRPPPALPQPVVLVPSPPQGSFVTTATSGHQGRKKRLQGERHSHPNIKFGRPRSAPLPRSVPLLRWLTPLARPAP